jgi:hypothetical protein
MFNFPYSYKRRSFGRYLGGGLGHKVPVFDNVYTVHNATGIVEINVAKYGKVLIYPATDIIISFINYPMITCSFVVGMSLYNSGYNVSFNDDIQWENNLVPVLNTNNRTDLAFEFTNTDGTIIKTGYVTAENVS